VIERPHCLTMNGVYTVSERGLVTPKVNQFPALSRRISWPNPPHFTWSICKRALTNDLDSQWSSALFTFGFHFSCHDAMNLSMTARSKRRSCRALVHRLFKSYEYDRHVPDATRVLVGCITAMVVKVSTFFDSNPVNVYGSGPDAEADWLPQCGSRDVWSATMLRKCKGCASQKEI
jgi:hypothetical protein